MEQTDFIIFVVRSGFISQAARIVIKSYTFFSFLLVFLLSVWQAAGLGALASKGSDCWGNHNNSKNALSSILFFILQGG